MIPFGLRGISTRSRVPVLSLSVPRVYVCLFPVWELSCESSCYLFRRLDNRCWMECGECDKLSCTYEWDEHVTMENKTDIGVNKNFIACR